MYEPYSIHDMLVAAKKIQVYADQLFCSDRELQTMTENFYAKFGRHWMTVI